MSVSTGKRIPFTAVVGKVWLFGLVLGLGTLGFGVIVSFITLYYADRGWQGAAFALTLMSCAFVGVRLVLGNVISRFGGRRVALLSFVVETAGLVLLWAAPAFRWCFQPCGVEAMKQVPAQNQGTAVEYAERLASAFIHRHDRLQLVLLQPGVANAQIAYHAPCATWLSLSSDGVHVQIMR